MEEIQNKLQDIRNPVAAMTVLLREMDLETDSEFGGEGAVGAGRELEGVVAAMVSVFPPTRSSVCVCVCVQVWASESACLSCTAAAPPCPSSPRPSAT